MKVFIFVSLLSAAAAQSVTVDSPLGRVEGKLSK